MGREKILLDTDIGTEVDDAITLAYLLANPDAEIMGITTVTGEAAERARLASVLCRIAGGKTYLFIRDVKILFLFPRLSCMHRRKRYSADGNIKRNFRLTVRLRSCRM